MGAEEPYEVVDGQELEQGDLIKNFPVYIPEYKSVMNKEPDAGEYTGYLLNAKEYRYDVIVMTQSCDLRPDKVKWVVLCPYWSLEEIINKREKFRPRKMQEKIRQGNIPNLHMLNACTLNELSQGIQIVDFHSVYTAPFSFLTQFAASQGRRLRLRSPYKEKLSQAFGHFFSRVGLPTDIPPFG
ncbi:MAG TPA: hypothetical protein DHW02_19150 [Ktedonobacter sp.]|nr:hypothetical protein [Ktedonobacter sp.]